MSLLTGLMAVGLFGRMTLAVSITGSPPALNEQEKIRRQKILITPKTIPKREETLKDILKVIVNPKPSFKIDVWVDKGEEATYYVGEKLIVYFKSNRDCYLTLFDFTPEGEVQQIFPNYWHQDNFIRAGKIYQIPAPEDCFEFTVKGPPGEEIIKAIATTTPRVLMLRDIDYRREFPFPFISRRAKEFAFKLRLRIEPIPRTQWTEDSCCFYVAERPITGKIKIESEPTFAKIYLDGKYKGRTPKTIYGVTKGYHSVKVTKRGYSDWSETIYVRRGETVELFAKLLTPYASIRVISTPSYARVFLDGIEKGRTPLTIERVERDRWHEVVVLKEHYYVYKAEFYIAAEEEPVDFKAELELIR